MDTSDGMKIDSIQNKTNEIPSPSISGVVRRDSLSRQLYSTDASIYKMRPEYVVFPFNTNDVETIHRWSDKHEVALTPRGGGTSLSGQSIGQGAVIDYSKQLNQILDWDPDDECVTVQPGVVLENLNEFLAEHGYQFGPDVATSNRATLGGMIGNNSAGAHSIRYGHTADHVRSLRCVLANGETVTFEPISIEEAEKRADQSNLEGQLYRRIPNLVEESRELISDRVPELMRNVSGYAVDNFMDTLEKGMVDFTQLVCGSEGTLATVVEAELDVVPAIEKTGLVVLECQSLEEALNANRVAIEQDPHAVELLDDKLLELAENSLEFSRYMDWIEGNPEAVLIVETGTGPGEKPLEDQHDRLTNTFREAGFEGTIHSVFDETLQENIWTVRKSGLPLLLGIPGDEKPTTFVEDTAVEPAKLASYVSDFQELVAEYGTEAAFYGHSSVGCLHIRPLVNLKTSDGVERMRDMARDVVELVHQYNGALSGEHGDGRARTEWLDEFYGDEMTELFRTIKETFDPEYRLNPGNVVGNKPMNEDLRFGSGYQANPPETVQDFTDQGGFTEIVERCNGSAVCRKENSGTMCPSYMVTRDETHSTRGRANALRGLMDGDLEPDALADGRMAEVMDLCISCKACKSECPSEVDMAPLNEEIQHLINQENGPSLRARVFAGIGKAARKLAPLQPLPNFLVSLPGVKEMLKRLLDLRSERSLPSLSSNPLDSSNYPETISSVENPVVLYLDTFSGYFQSDVARKALKLLKRSGFDPLVPETPCCGRPYMSKGFLEKAREQVEKTVEVLDPYARRDVPILVLEPSCFSVLTDDLTRYVPGKKSEAIAENTQLFSSFMNENWDLLSERLQTTYSEDLLLHGHCHQKALLGEEDLISLMEVTTEGQVEYVDSGCCGMAGSFGYEKEHYHHSRKMAERKLVPNIRSDETPGQVIAPGISCRQQIEHFTDSTVKHPVQLLADAFLPPSGG